MIRFSSIKGVPFKLPHDFNHLTVPGAADSYLAFVKADGDGLGKFLAGLEWEKVSWDEAPPKPHQKARCFADHLNMVFISSLEEAISEVVLPKLDPASRFPVAPILAGGEDVWLMCRRDLALPLVSRYSQIFSGKAKEDPVIAGAFSTSATGESLTMSAGVLFAQKGYPFDSQSDLVAELIKSS